MLQKIFENFELLELPLISMFIFMAVFLGGSFMAFFRKREDVDSISSLPLCDSEIIISGTKGDI